MIEKYKDQKNGKNKVSYDDKENSPTGFFSTNASVVSVMYNISSLTLCICKMLSKDFCYFKSNLNLNILIFRFLFYDSRCTLASIILYIN